MVVSQYFMRVDFHTKGFDRTGLSRESPVYEGAEKVYESALDEKVSIGGALTHWGGADTRQGTGQTRSQT